MNQKSYNKEFKQIVVDLYC